MILVADDWSTGCRITLIKRSFVFWVIR